MYDPRAEPKEFIGESRSEAVSKACSFFGCDESGLSIHEVEEGQVFGMASRVAVVAVPKDAEASSRPRRATRERESSRERAPRRERRERREAREPEEPVGGPSEGKALGELGSTGTFVLGLLERLEMGSFEIGESQDGENLVLRVQGPAARRLTEADGRVVGALQLLAGQVSMRQEPDQRRVILDIDGQEEKRSEQLERVAKRAAARAEETGRGVALEPMSPRDRRLVHVALRDVEGIATMSVGEGRYKQVVVVPEGAPEYEEAKRQEASLPADS